MQQNVLAGGADYVAYADETHHNIGRYRGVGLITLKAVDDSKMRYDLEQILTGTAIVELKWGELRSAKKRFVAIRVFNYIIEQAIAGNLRLDVLTWDIEDSRHKIQGRNDVRNLQQYLRQKLAK